MASAPTPLRVLFLSPRWPAEGAANGVVSYTAAIREGLAGCGVESRVVTSDPDPAARSDEVVDMVGAAEESPSARLGLGILGRLRPDLASAIRTARELEAAVEALYERWPFDLLEVEESWGMALRAARSRGFPTVVRLHGPWFLNGCALGAPRNLTFAERDARERRLLRAAFAVSAPARDVLERSRRHFGLALAQARVIPNPARDVAPDRRWAPDPAGPPSVLFVGRFDRHKGGDLVIDAFREIAVGCPRAELLFVGPEGRFPDERGRVWGLDEYVAERIPDEGARARVRRLGPRAGDELALLRRRASVTVVASRYEVFGLTAAEALAAGAPLVAAEVGGLAEMLRPGENALGFAPGEASDLARRVLDVLRSPDLAARLGAGARRLFEERYAPSAVAPAALAFYREVIARHRATYPGAERVRPRETRP